jgi:hypothetical protein
MSKRELKQVLATFDNKKLIGLISELYDKNKSVKEYLDYYLKPDEREKLKVYKARIKEALFPHRGISYNLVSGKKTIADFRKIDPSAESLVDLMLYYVECGVEFTNNYGDINENYYVSLAKMYRDSLGLIDENSLHNIFKERAHNIVNLSENIAWGFSDAVLNLYLETFSLEDI